MTEVTKKTPENKSVDNLGRKVIEGALILSLLLGADSVLPNTNNEGPIDNTNKSTIKQTEKATEAAYFDVNKISAVNDTIVPVTKENAINTIKEMLGESVIGNMLFVALKNLEPEALRQLYLELTTQVFPGGLYMVQGKIYTAGPILKQSGTMEHKDENGNIFLIYPNGYTITILPTGEISLWVYKNEVEDVDLVNVDAFILQKQIVPQVSFHKDFGGSFDPSKLRKVLEDKLRPDSTGNIPAYPVFFQRKEDGIHVMLDGMKLENIYPKIINADTYNENMVKQDGFVLKEASAEDIMSSEFGIIIKPGRYILYDIYKQTGPNSSNIVLTFNQKEYNEMRKMKMINEHNQNMITLVNTDGSKTYIFPLTMNKGEKDGLLEKIKNEGFDRKGKIKEIVKDPETKEISLETLD